MKLIDSVEEMQNVVRQIRRAGKTIALVPTMGYLHDGHASLLREGRARADFLVTSIFVNPTQFGPNEDYQSYPRSLERDCSVAEAAGVDVVFAPQPSAMYPEGYQTFVNVEQLTLPLCGADRPGHFRGVTTVVAKLFNIVMPHVALFGKKDFQQLAVIRRMVADLNMDITLIGMPIVREADGLALSSRNAYLSPDERGRALCLNRALRATRALFADGERSAAVLRSKAVGIINDAAASIDYVEFRHSETLEEVATVDRNTLVALAVRIGSTRLIDNCILGEEN